MQKQESAAQTTALSGMPNTHELVEQYHHQLLCLEADLKDCARTGHIRPREYAARIKKLSAVQQQLDQLQNLSSIDRNGKITDHDIGLPILENCTPAELETCETALMEKELELLRVERDITKVHNWLRDAVAGKSGSFALTLRLSKLRRLIQTYSKLSTQAENDATQIDQNSAELTKSIKFKRSEATGRSSLQTLMDLFNDLEKVISRIANLRTKLRQETKKVSEMNAWLQCEETRFEQGLKSHKQPSPLVLAQNPIAGLINNQSGLSKKSIERRKLVETFWREIIHGDPTSPSKSPGKYK